MKLSGGVRTRSGKSYNEDLEGTTRSGKVFRPPTPVVRKTRKTRETLANQLQPQYESDDRQPNDYEEYDDQQQDEYKDDDDLQDDDQYDDDIQDDDQYDDDQYDDDLQEEDEYDDDLQDDQYDDLQEEDDDLQDEDEHDDRPQEEDEYDDLQDEDDQEKYDDQPQNEDEYEDKPQNKDNDDRQEEYEQPQPQQRWYENATIFNEGTPYPSYQDGLPSEWIQLEGQGIPRMQQYLNAAFTGQSQYEGGSTGFQPGAHDWTSSMRGMMEGKDRCETIFNYDTPKMTPWGGKQITVCQAIVNRLAEFVSATEARGFLAWHSVGSGKTISSALILDAFYATNKDLFFITAPENLAQVGEMFADLPLVSSRRAFRDAGTQGRVQALFMDRTPKVRYTVAPKGRMLTAEQRKKDFAQGYQDFALALNVNELNVKYRTADGRLSTIVPRSAFLDEGPNYRWPALRSYFDQDGNEIKSKRPWTRIENPYVDEDGNYRPLKHAVIVLDEVQNMLNAASKREIFTYEHLREEILKEPTCKVMMLTATPGDTPEQTIKLLNLLIRPPRYLKEGSAAYARSHPSFYLSVGDYFDELTGTLKEGFVKRIQDDLSSRNVYVSFVHANEDKSVFSNEVCDHRDRSARCGFVDATYDTVRHTIQLPFMETGVPKTHVRVLAEMGPAQEKSTVRTDSGPRSAVVGTSGELRNGIEYAYSAYRTTKTPFSNESQSHYDTKWPEYKSNCKAKGDDTPLPVCRLECDVKGGEEKCKTPIGVPESQFLANVRKFSSIIWKGQRYSPPKVESMKDVYDKISSKLAALLSIVKQYPDEKHAVIVSNFAKNNTGKGYLTQLGYALHLALSNMGKEVMGWTYKPLVLEKGRGQHQWTVDSVRHEAGTKQFALYLNQMPEDVKRQVAKTFNDFEHNFGSVRRLNADGTERADKGPGCNLIITNRIEGLSLMSVRHIHIFDAPVSTKNYFQSIGRGVRLCSSRGLPNDLWNTIVYEYFSTVPERMVNTYDKCSQAKLDALEIVQLFRNKLKTLLYGDVHLSTPRMQDYVFYLNPPVATQGDVRVSIASMGKDMDVEINKEMQSGDVVLEGFDGDLWWLNGPASVLKQIRDGKVTYLLQKEKPTSAAASDMWDKISVYTKSTRRFFDRRQFAIMSMLLPSFQANIDELKSKVAGLLACNKKDVHDSLYRVMEAEAKVRALTMALVDHDLSASDDAKKKPSKKKKKHSAKRTALVKMLNKVRKEYDKAASLLRLSQSTTAQCVFAPRMEDSIVFDTSSLNRAVGMIQRAASDKNHADDSPVEKAIRKSLGASLHPNVKDAIGRRRLIHAGGIAGDMWDYLKQSGTQAIAAWTSAMKEWWFGDQTPTPVDKQFLHNLMLLPEKDEAEPAANIDATIKAHMETTDSRICEHPSAQAPLYDLNAVDTRKERLEVYDPKAKQWKVASGTLGPDQKTRTVYWNGKKWSARKPKHPGLTFSPDQFLTSFAAQRYVVAYELTRAIMGAAVDCSLLHKFHTGKGAMYPLVTCMGNRKALCSSQSSQTAQTCPRGCGWTGDTCIPESMVNAWDPNSEFAHKYARLVANARP